MNHGKQAHQADQPAGASLEQQAWAWLRLLHSGRARQFDLDGFERWVRADPTHRAAYGAARREWQTLGEAAGVYAQGVRTSTEPRLNQGRRRLVRWAAGGACAAVAGAVVWQPPLGLWPSPLAWGADATAVGEQRAMAMAPGVQVTLNTQTRIRRQVVDGRVQGMHLLEGEAAVDLASGENTEVFTMQAGAASSMAVAGRFDLRFLAGKVCVSCLAGSIQVRHPAGERTLSARQQVVYDDRQISGVGEARPEQVTAWRNGELRFDKTPLRVVLDEINRYRPGKVVLFNDAVREQPVSGSFYIASLDMALAQLQRTFKLEAKVLPAGLYLLT